MNVGASFLWGLLVTAGAASAIAAMAGACIPHPDKDYEDFLKKTENLRGTTPTDSGPPADGAAPTDTIEGLYFASCYPGDLAAGDIQKVLRFYTEVKFVPGVAGASGTLDLKLSPMIGWDVAGSTPVAPKSVSKSEIRGNAFIMPTASVNAGGKFESVYREEVNLVADANSLSGRAITLQPVKFAGIFSATAGPGDGGADSGTDGGAKPRPRFCSTLEGAISKPIVQQLDPAKNFCLFFPANEGDPLPAITLGDYVCNVK